MVKVGDKVSAEVTDVCKASGSVKVGSGAWLWPNEFEPVAVADSNGNVEHGNRFKVGDRVRCIDDSSTTRVAKGKVYTVEGIKGEFITIRGDNMYNYRFEPVDAPLTIREGGYYKTRDGRKVGPMHKEKESRYWWTPDDAFFWHPDGRVFLTTEHPDDFIAEWTDAPSSADIFDKLEDWMADNPPPTPVLDTPTTGFTVPLDAPEFGGAESKFKVGDRVECADGKTNGVGAIIKVLNGSEFDYIVRVESKDAKYAYYPEGVGRKFSGKDLRLVAEATTAQEPRFVTADFYLDEPPTTIADIVRRLERLESAMWQRAA